MVCVVLLEINQKLQIYILLYVLLCSTCTYKKNCMRGSMFLFQAIKKEVTPTPLTGTEMDPGALLWPFLVITYGKKTRSGLF